MSTTELKSTFNRMSEINSQLSNDRTLTTDKYLELRQEFNDLEEAMHNAMAIECIASGEHFAHITSQGGYDICANCGAKS